MHTSYTNHKQTLISYLLQYYFSVYYISFVHFWVVIFLRSVWSGEYNGRWAINPGLLFLFGRRKRKLRTPDRRLMGD